MVHGIAHDGEGAALPGNMPMYKYIGNKILTCMENALIGTKLSEFHSGYRAYSVQRAADDPARAS